MENPRNVTVVCYLEKENKMLMLHRTKKEKDINAGKWIGVGGHVETWESPEDAVVREVLEETGYHLQDWKSRGLVTFCYNDEPAMYMFLYTSEHFYGEESICNEGDLRWIPKNEILTLDLWEGDRIFHRLLETREDFFALKMVYEGDTLVDCYLDGKKIEVS